MIRGRGRLGRLDWFPPEESIQFYTLYGKRSIMSPSPRALSRSAEPNPHPRLIADKQRLADLASRLSERSTIALDTEFVREKTYFPQLGLIQIADRDEAWLVDPLALDARAIDPLLDVLRNPKILKVVHSAEQDQICLFHGYGMVAEPVFDTSIGAALCGLGDQIGLANLLKKILDIQLPKTHTRADWLRRPLPEAMVVYALADVEHLVETAEQLLAKLDARDRREWALEVSSMWSDRKRYDPDPDTLAEKLAGSSGFSPRRYAVLRRVIRWRENRARSSDIPRKWIADDQVLTKLAAAAPRKSEELSHFRGLKVKPDSHAGHELLDAIGEALAIPDEQLVKPPVRPEPRPHEGPALSVLRCFINLLAHEQGVAARFLADGETLVKLLRGKFRDSEDLKQSKLLPAAVVDHVGEEFLAVLNGGLGLRLERGRVERCAWENNES